MTTTIQTTDHRQPTTQTRLAISFDMAKLTGQHDADIQPHVDAVKRSLSESNRLFEIASAAVRNRSAEKVLAVWETMQHEGRRLTDDIRKAVTAVTKAKNNIAAADNSLRSTEMALIGAASASLDRRPTEAESKAHDAAIAKAEAGVTAAKQSLTFTENRHRQFAGQLAKLQNELTEFETREAEVARDYQRITGALPGRPHQQSTAVQSTDGLLA